VESDRWEGELHQYKRDGSQIIVASRWTTLRDKDRKAFAWLEINTDITARKRAEEAARRLSAQLLTLQDGERRRIAKGLHDSLGQYLAALKMNLDRFPSLTREQSAAVASESAQIVDKCLTETRTISHLLHPPLLDEAGFGTAARWYVEGFAQRSKIAVSLNLPQELLRLHPDIELALFRALQECLTNIHKHAGSSLVDIRMTQDAKQVRLEIADNGQGIPKDRLQCLLRGAGRVGVGIAGMRERFREVGGSLDIRSNHKGTTVIVTIPKPQGSAIGSGKDSKSKRTTSAA
jgi:two-component system NarL family sensor kinase